MGIDELTIRLLLLFFPGIICSYIVDKLTIHEPRSQFHFLLRSFVFGLTSYFVYWIGVKIINIGLNCVFNRSIQIVFLESFSSESTHISWIEIIIVTCIAIILGVLFTLESTYKYIFESLYKRGITKRFADLDVWGYTFNKPNKNNIEWITVRDLDYDLVYDGWFEAFSDDSKNAEILLRDVSVYKNSTADFLYQVGALYLSRKRENITLEFRNIPVSEEYTITTSEEKNE